MLTPSPEYPLYGAIMAKLDCPANAYDLDEDNGWEPDVADMERKINSRTRAILLITPNNPTGAVYSKRTLEKILELARRHNLIIFADEIYDKLIFDPNEKHVSIATLATDVPIVTFNGLSKSYLVPGWRIGWAIATGPREVAASVHGSRAPFVARAFVGAASIPARHQAGARRSAGPPGAKCCAS